MESWNIGVPVQPYSSQVRFCFLCCSFRFESSNPELSNFSRPAAGKGVPTAAWGKVWRCLQRTGLFSICNGRDLAPQPLLCTWIKAGLSLSRDFNFSFSLNIPKDHKGRMRRINETTTLLIKWPFQGLILHPHRALNTLWNQKHAAHTVLGRGERSYCGQQNPPASQEGVTALRCVFGNLRWSNHVVTEQINIPWPARTSFYFESHLGST